MKALALLLVIGLGACRTIDSLKPGVERVCTKNRCYMFGTKEQIDRHCRKGVKKWDDGKVPHPNDGKRARCCTKYRGPWARIRIWVSRDDANCLAHEECHIEEFESLNPNHARCDGFGVGRSKKRL